MEWWSGVVVEWWSGGVVEWCRDIVFRELTYEFITVVVRAKIVLKSTHYYYYIIIIIVTTIKIVLSNILNLEYSYFHL